MEIYDLAEDCFRQILSVEPNNDSASNMLGMLLTDQARYKEAEHILPNPAVFHNVNIQFSLGVLYLGQGRYKEGWPLYERCWVMNRGEDFAIKKFNRVPKSLEDMKDKNILLYHDHGLGDSIQFVRYISLVKKYTKKYRYMFRIL